MGADSILYKIKVQIFLFCYAATVLKDRVDLQT